MTRDLRWELLSSTYVYKDRWFIARADSCRLPDGRVIEPYYVLEMPNWCNVVVVTEDEKIVFVKQYRHAITTTTIELPGGVIDKGETPEQAAIREVREETGFQVDEVEFMYKVAPNPATNSNTAYFFLGRNAKPVHALNFDPFEDIDVLIYSKEEVKQLLADNGMQHGVQIGALYEAFVRLGWLQWTF